MLLHYLEEFKNYLNFEKRASTHTIAAYNQDIKQFLNILNVHYPSSLTTKAIKKYRYYLSSRSYNPRTIARKCSSIQSFIHFLHRESLIEKSLNFKLIKPKLPKQLPKSLSLNQIEKLIQSPKKASRYPHRDMAILELLYTCGLRISECLSLKKNNVKENSIRVTGKGHIQRLIPIGTPAKLYLKTYLNREYIQLNTNNKSTNLFLNNRGNSFTRQGLFILIKKYMNATNIKASPHTLRHTFATHLLEGNANIREVQELLGHKNITSTQIYTNLSLKKIKHDYLNSHPLEKTKNTKLNTC